MYAMKYTRTYYHLILDRSGSMTSCIEQTVDGVNQQIRRIKEVSERFPDQELITSLTLFNDRLTRAWSLVRPGNLREISFADYQPEGFTALLDAIGTTIADMHKSTGAEIEAGEASVVVVIITDGHENSSREFSHGQVASLIRELEMTGKWTFTYLGATLDAVEIATSLNIQRNNAMHFKPDDYTLVYNKLDKSLYSYLNEKETGKIKNDFLENEDDKH